jgi:hypothetical protein
VVGVTSSPLAALSDDRLFEVCEDTITKAAYGNPDAADQIGALMRESKARHQRLPRYVFECPGGIYERAWATAMARQTFTDLHLPVCDCAEVA